MKNKLNLILVTFISFFLFACDSSNTAKTTSDNGGGGTATYTVEVEVTGSLTGSSLVVESVGTNDKLTFTNIGKQTLPTALADKATYNVQIVAGTGQPTGHTCKVLPGNNNNQIPKANVIVTVNCLTGGIGNGISSIGKNYYMSECAVCHSAGSDDRSVALGAVSDLAAKYKARVLTRETTDPSKVERIATDMHGIGPGFNLMGRFEGVKAESIDNLRAYLASVQP